MIPAGSEPNSVAAVPRLVVGLGNPGAEYDGTRHNLGFAVLDRLAEALGLRLARQARVKGLGPVKARTASGTDEQGEFLLVKPWTYMNLSGRAVSAYARHFRVPPESIFVILDDLNLPLGRMRIRAGGSPGGHNGLESVIADLGSEGFPRLRMGIATEGVATADMADPDFVLGRFSEEEQELIAPVLVDAVEATREWLAGAALDVLMTRFNSRRPSGSD